MSDLLSRVLLVEDDEGDALLVRECLFEAGVPEVDVLWQRTLADGINALADAPGLRPARSGPARRGRSRRAVPARRRGEARPRSSS